MKKFLTFLMTLLMSIGMYAQQLVYTLDGTITDGNNGYATESDITQNSMEWKVMGNTTMSPWRIGGKTLSNVDRPIYSTTSMSSTVSNVKIEVGAASNITVNSLKLIVSKNANFSNPIDDVTKTFAANSTIEFTPTSGSSWAENSYYKIIFNVSVNGSSNKFVEFKNAKFYGNSGSSVTTPVISGTTPFVNDTEVSITCSTTGTTIYYTTDGNDPTNNSIQYTAPFTLSSTTTVKAIAYNGNNHSGIVSKDFIKLEHVSTIGALNALTDNTEFVFDGEAVCVYQHGPFTYIQDETAATLLYGTLNDGVTYEITDVIPSGWQGKKTAYDGYSEVINLSGFTAATTNQNLEATELDLSNIAKGDFGKYVVVKNVLISTDTPEPPTPTGHELTHDIIKVTGTSYTTWTNIQGGTSNAIYAGQTAGGNDAIQMRSNNSNSGIVTTTSAGLVKSVSITWNENTISGRTVSIYGKNTPYSAAADLYDSNEQGTLLGEINIDENTTMITVNGNYAYWGVCSKSGALYLDAIDVVWDSSSSSAPMRAQTVTDNYTLTDEDGNTLNAYPSKLGYSEIPDDLTQRYDAYGVLDFHGGNAQLLPLGFIDSEGTITSVIDINDDQVIDMKYYDIMGRQSSKPFNGLNIVIIKHKNGKTDTVKIIR